MRSVLHERRLKRAASLPFGEGRVAARARPRTVSPTLISVLMRAADCAALGVTGVIAHRLRQGDLDFSGIELTSGLVALLLAVNLTSAMGAYDRRHPARMGQRFRRAAAGWCLAVAGLLVLSFLLKTSDQISRLWILAWLGLGVAGLGGVRIVASLWLARLRRHGSLSRPVLVIGRGRDGEERLRQLEDNEPDAAVLGYLDLDTAHRSVAPSCLSAGITRLAAMHDVPPFLRGSHVDHVILALPWREQAGIRAIVDQLRSFPVEVTFLPTDEDDPLLFRDVAWVGGLSGLKLLDRPLDECRALVKSLEDRVLGCLLLAATLPLLAVLAIAVKATSRGPVLFRQRRVGFNANTIEVFKLRSMYADDCDTADASQVRQASRNDPRVTPLGRFMRRTSLDELPQLFNVVLGEMSLVGPRPHALAHDDYYAALIDDYLARHRVKPGITGWAQVNGLRGEVDGVDHMRRRIRYDLQYIEHWSLWFDLYILLRTVGLVFWDRRAF